MLFYLTEVGKCRTAHHSSNNKEHLPFICPYEIKDKTGPGLDPGLRGSPGTDLNQVTGSFYAQYKAATAQVPCDATVMRVFTEKQLGKDYTVGVIFVYESSVDRLKHWLE